MKTELQDVMDLLHAKRKLVWVNTYEEERFIKDLALNSKRDAKLVNYDILEWSAASGVSRVFTTPAGRIEKEIVTDKAQPKIVMDQIFAEVEKPSNAYKPSIFILKDFDYFLEKDEVIYRRIRDFVEIQTRTNDITIIVLTSNTNVPARLNRLTYTVSYSLPKEDEIRDYFSKFRDALNKKLALSGEKDKMIDDKLLEQLVKSSAGLSIQEVEAFSKISLASTATLDLSVLHGMKLDLIERTGVLEYKETKATMDKIGGNEAFKQWVSDIKMAFSPEAEAFGLPKPKGYLALGIPGTSKTYAAEALAGEMNIPMIQLSLSKIMDRKVGASEQRAMEAFRIIKANAPCLLLIDEVEKEIGGVASSNSTDGGTVSRIFAQLLKFLNDNKEVFVVMTSNDVSKLPSELTRSGRLDAKWYFGLPNNTERKEIARIHLDSTNKPYDEELLNDFVSATANYTGAEIKEAAQGMVKYLFNDFVERGQESFTTEHLMKSVATVVPIYDSSRESILSLETWARTRALNASGQEQNQSSQYADPNDIIVEL